MSSRICKVCGCKLSKYNENDICFHHREVDQLVVEDSIHDPIQDKSKRTIELDK